jgi:HSP20 family protein
MNALAEKENPTAAPAPARVENNFVAPDVNIVESKEGYVIEAEMPGVNKEGLSVHLEDNVLTLEGRRRSNGAHGQLLYGESRAANFRRVFELAPEIDVERVSAHIEQGVLTVQLPKAEKAKPRRIAVN